MSKEYKAAEGIYSQKIQRQPRNTLMNKKVRLENNQSRLGDGQVDELKYRDPYGTAPGEQRNSSGLGKSSDYKKYLQAAQHSISTDHNKRQNHINIGDQNISV